MKPLWSAALVAALGACAPAAGPVSAPVAVATVPRTSPVEAPPPAGPAGATPESSAQKRVADFLARVAAVRHLPPRAGVQARVLDRSALIESVKQHVAREVPRNVIRDQGELLVGFGMVPPDFDYEQGAFKLLESQLAGFYEPHDKRMYLASDLQDRVADATLAHELVHALQDQYYDLGARLSYQPEANDRESAVQALAEGDATSAMMDLMFADSGRRATDIPDDVFAAEVESSMTSGPDGGGVPRVLRASLVAPYVDGVMFVNTLRRRSLAKRGVAGGGWDAVDEAWRSPPTTTEQLLHMDKYDAHEPAEVLSPPVSPPGSWTTVYDDSFGEEGLRIGVEMDVEEVGGALGAGVGRQSNQRFFARQRVVSPAPRPSPIRASRSSGVSVSIAGRVKTLTPRVGKPSRLWRPPSRLPPRPQPPLCVERPSLGPLAISRSGRDLVIVGGPYRRTGSRVVPDALCTQSVRWAADVLSKSK